MGKEHEVSMKLGLKTSPEVFMFNLNWNDEPLPSQILKILVSIPEKFSLNKLFDKTDKGEA